MEEIAMSSSAVAEPVTKGQILSELQKISFNLGADVVFEGDRIVKITLRGRVSRYSQKAEAINVASRLAESSTCEVIDTTTVGG